MRTSTPRVERQRRSRPTPIVFVTPEYNYFAPPALVNALDYVLHEWAYKPAGILSYGGVSGGMRSAQMLKLLLTGLKVMPIPESVNVANFRQFIGEDGIFAPNELLIGAARTMLDELSRWTVALQPIRCEIDATDVWCRVGVDLVSAAICTMWSADTKPESAAQCPSPRKPSSKD